MYKIDKQTESILVCGDCQSHLVRERRFAYMEYQGKLTYTNEVIFEWDEKKDKENFRKHKISFAEGKTIFYDPFSITIPDPDHSVEETRFIDVGMSNASRILIVVYTERKERLRIIGVRKATKAERKKYEEERQ